MTTSPVQAGSTSTTGRPRVVIVGTGFGGPAFLTTIGYDYQYFYTIKKAFHQVHLDLRMGWDWHKL